MKQFILVISIILGLQVLSLAQTLQTSPTPPKNDDEEVVVVSTNLIQVDAIVTDKNGKQVTDLKPEDFVVLQNGEKQDVTNFSYVQVTPDAAESAGNEKAKPQIVDKNLPPVPTRLKPEQVRRTIALVADDLGLSFESVYFVRQALKKFVDEQMQPNDLVAIVRTSGGIGALQQFTSDKRQLYAAIEKVKWNPIGRGGVGAFAPIQSTLTETIATQTGVQEDADRAAQEKQATNEFDSFRNDVFSVGTLGALNFIVKGMSELPGRKAAVLFSDGFRLTPRDEDGNYDSSQGARVLNSLRNLTELANRASVVVSTIDARGLQTTWLTAADDTGGLSFDQLSQRLLDRRNELFDTQDGLIYLARETGGRSFYNNNDIKGSVQKVLDDQKGYYLLGYQPDEATFDKTKRRFNKLEIKLNRPGLKVRYRSGFFGVETEDIARPAKQTAQQQIFNALTSPFGANGIDLRLNALFGSDPKTGAYIRSLLHVNAGDLKFIDEADGSKKAVFEVIAYTFGDNGVPIDQIASSYTMVVKKDKFQQALRKGFVYYLNLPIKKPGAYQLRIALRDSQNEKIGAASQFVEVPNLKKDRLALSSIVLQNLTLAQYDKLIQNPAAPAAPAAPKSEAEVDESPDTQTDTALRRFRRGTALIFLYEIYNAKTVGAVGRPQLQSQTRVFRDGKPLFEGKPTALNTENQADAKRLSANSVITLPAQMELGNYVLQVIVTDALAKKKSQIASQYVEFELVN